MEKINVWDTIRLARGLFHLAFTVNFAYSCPLCHSPSQHGGRITTAGRYHVLHKVSFNQNQIDCRDLIAALYFVGAQVCLRITVAKFAAQALHWSILAEQGAGSPLIWQPWKCQLTNLRVQMVCVCVHAIEGARGHAHTSLYFSLCEDFHRPQF